MALASNSLQIEEMGEKAAPSKKKAPEVETTVIHEEDLFEDFALQDGTALHMTFIHCIYVAFRY